jgi:mono/diheme cytochrome c family protein
VRRAPVRKLVLSGLLLAAATAVADEDQVRLKEGPGKDLVVGNCVMCHSLDYIPMNSVFLDRKGWEASVNKMVKVMGAPIQAEDIPKIQDYLVTQYGKR